MRRAFVAGNWKMNGTRGNAKTLCNAIAAGLSGISAQVVICPPFTLIDTVREAVAGSTIGLGAQNVNENAAGAFTGEVSPGMLSDAGCEFVIVGHSERRALYDESDARVAAKFLAAREAGLTPIVCVGETLDEHEADNTQAVVGRQLGAVIDAAGVESLVDAVIAYEPVWAIGTGKTATPEQAQSVHAFLRAQVAAHSADVAAGVRIVYGGSVKGANAAELFACEDIDGGLIGGASLIAGDFLTICAAGS
jgi:triosephosphate isomerase